MLQKYITLLVLEHSESLSVLIQGLKTTIMACKSFPFSTSDLINFIEHTRSIS